MSAWRFSKWEGTGNDFIVIDDRPGAFPSADLSLVQRLCDRHFGIGSDGLILLQAPRRVGMAYHMDFINPDGTRSFCGNGSRCAFAFFVSLQDPAVGAAQPPIRFTAVDGEHGAEWSGERVAVSLADVPQVSREADIDFVHNGSPHELVWVDDPDAVDIMSEGPRRAHHPSRGSGGTNVNFMRVIDGRVHVRTFERGVEAETLSCGTGVVAAALSALSRHAVEAPVEVIARGGTLRVEAETTDGVGWGRIKLIGPVRHVFDGEMDLSMFRSK